MYSIRDFKDIFPPDYEWSYTRLKHFEESINTVIHNKIKDRVSNKSFDFGHMFEDAFCDTEKFLDNHICMEKPYDDWEKYKEENNFMANQSEEKFLQWYNKEKHPAKTVVSGI